MCPGQKGGATRDFRAFFHEHCPSFPASSWRLRGVREPSNGKLVVTLEMKKEKKEKKGVFFIGSANEGTTPRYK